MTPYRTSMQFVLVITERKEFRKMKNDNTIMLAIAVYAAAMTMVFHLVALA